MADPERFTLKSNPVTSTGAFVKFYNWKNRGQVYEIQSIVELEKMRALTAKNSRNLGAYEIIGLSSILYYAHDVPRDQDKFVFYVHNYID